MSHCRDRRIADNFKRTVDQSSDVDIGVPVTVFNIARSLGKMFTALLAK
jgi:hypothetical protein